MRSRSKPQNPPYDVELDGAPTDIDGEVDPNVSVDDASLLPAVRAFMALARQLAAEEEQ